LFCHLLEPTRWTVATANVPGIIRLFAAFFRKHAIFHDLIAKHMQDLLLRFQYCLNHKKLWRASFDFLNDMVQYLPLTTYVDYFQKLVLVLLTRVHECKTEALSENIVLSLSLFCCKRDPNELTKALNATQPDLVHNFFKHIFIPGASRVASKEEYMFFDKKICAVALSKLLCVPDVLKYPDVVESILKTTLELAGISSQTPAAAAQDAEEEDDFTVGAGGDFQGTFNSLGAVRVDSKDRLQEIGNVGVEIRVATTHPSLLGVAGVRQLPAFNALQQLVGTL